MTYVSARSRSYSGRQVAESYDATRFSSQAGKLLDLVERQIVSAFAPEDGKKRLVADIGTGTGRFAIGLIRSGFKVVASDASLAMLLTGRRKLKASETNRARFVLGDIYNLPLKQNSIAYVICIHVLNQLGDIRDQVRAIGELIRVCAPGGRIVFDAYSRKSMAAFAPGSKTGLVRLPDLEQQLARIETVRIHQVVGRFLIPITSFRILPVALQRKLDYLDQLASARCPGLVTKAYYCLIKRERG